jgi:hypothetical protein
MITEKKQFETHAILAPKKIEKTYGPPEKMLLSTYRLKSGHCWYDI